ncbi:hypothetical protein ACQ4PT_026471 [Festuca glaucescens]
MERWLNCCFVALSTLVALCFLKLCRGNNKPKKHLPPGPWNLPVIGSLHHVVSVLPLHRMVTELCRWHGPIMYLQLGEVPAVVVSSAKVLEQMMKANDAGAFVNRPTTAMQDVAGKGLLFAPYGDHWHQMQDWRLWRSCRGGSVRGVV